MNRLRAYLFALLSLALALPAQSALPTALSLASPALVASGTTDVDAADYFTRVAAVGSINQAGKSAANDFFKGVKSDGIFSSLDYFITPAAADLASSAVPFIKPAGVGNATFSGYVGADYAQSTGWANSGGKYIDTGFIPSTHFTSDFDGVIGGYIRQDLGTGGTSDCVCNFTGSPDVRFSWYGFGSNFSHVGHWTKISGGGQDFSVASTHGNDFFTSSRTAASAYTWYRRGVPIATDPTTITATRPTTNLRVAATGAVNSYGAWFVAHGWNDQKQALLWKRTLALGTKLGWATTQPEIWVVFSDSIGNGLQASDSAHQFFNLWVANKGYIGVKSSQSGRYLQNSNISGSPQVGNGRDSYVAEGVQKHPDGVVIELGINDVAYDSTTTGGIAGWTLTHYTTQLGEIVSGLINNAEWPISPDHIIIMAPSFTVTATWTRSAPSDGGSVSKSLAYGAACLSVAQTYHTKYMDGHAAMANRNGTSGLYVDNLHPNDTGHNDLYLGLRDDTVQESLWFFGGSTSSSRARGWSRRRSRSRRHFGDRVRKLVLSK